MKIYKTKLNSTFGRLINSRLKNFKLKGKHCGWLSIRIDFRKLKIQKRLKVSLLKPNFKISSRRHPNFAKFKC